MLRKHCGFFSCKLKNDWLLLKFRKIVVIVEIVYNFERIIKKKSNQKTQNVSKCGKWIVGISWVSAVFSIWAFRSIFQPSSYCLFRRLLQIPRNPLFQWSEHSIYCDSWARKILHWFVSVDVLAAAILSFVPGPPLFLRFFILYSWWRRCEHTIFKAIYSLLCLSFIPNVAFYILRCFHFFRNDLILGYFTLLFYINRLFSRTYIAYVNRLFFDEHRIRMLNIFVF